MNFLNSRGVSYARIGKKPYQKAVKRRVGY